MARLADFGVEVALPNGIAWAQYKGSGWVVPANNVDLDTTPQGLPALRLSFIRGALPFQPPDPTARLDCTAICSVDTAAAVTVLRQTYPQATAMPLWPDRSQITMGDILLSPDSGDQLSLNGTRKARIIRELGWDGGQAVAALLRAGTNPLRFSGAAAFYGISPRVAASVQVTSQTLRDLAALLPNDAATWEEINRALRSHLPSLGIAETQAMDLRQQTALCATLTDRIFDLCSTHVAHNTSGHPMARLMRSLDAAYVWDLSKPYKTQRWIDLAPTNTSNLDTFLAMGRGEALITDRTIASFPKGQHALTIYSTFDADTTDTGMIAASNGSVELNLRLALGENLSYQLSTFAVGQTGGQMWQKHVPPQARNDYLVALGPADFGFEIFEITVARDILAVANLTLDFDTSTPLSQPIGLTSESQFIIAPVDAAEQTCTITARQISGDGYVVLNMGPLASFDIATSAFANHGQQSVRIIQPTDNENTIGLEVKPIGAEDEDITTLAFNDRTPERTYVYTSNSLFEPGFVYRLMGQSNWLSHTDQTVALHLDTDLLSG